MLPDSGVTCSGFPSAHRQAQPEINHVLRPPWVESPIWAAIDGANGAVGVRQPRRERYVGDQPDVVTRIGREPPAPVIAVRVRRLAVVIGETEATAQEEATVSGGIVVEHRSKVGQPLGGDGAAGVIIPARLPPQV